MQPHEGTRIDFPVFKKRKVKKKQAIRAGITRTTNNCTYQVRILRSLLLIRNSNDRQHQIDEIKRAKENNNHEINHIPRPHCRSNLKIVENSLKFLKIHVSKCFPVKLKKTRRLVLFWVAIFFLGH